ncbi:MAG TPA: DUF4339 domain-containing protein [Streptosporangiaceae bacterium]|nr:DUF4339 domain-containing protein [Streptosporangiaceae bacterium]
MAIGQQVAQQIASAASAPAASPQGENSGAPPPLPGAFAPIYVALNGAQAGPFAKDELVARIASGEVTRDSLVWREQMAGWAPANQVPDVAALFGVVPPPLPAQ